MKIYFLIITLLMLPCRIFAQQPDCVDSSEEDYENRLQTGIIGREYQNPVEGYKGNQYFNIWSLGEVTLNGGDVIRDIFLQYDRFLDELLWLREADFRKGLLNKQDIAGFRIIGSRDVPAATFVKRRITLPWIGSVDAFLQVLVKGEISFYAYRNVAKVPNDYQLNDNTVYLIATPGHDYLIKLRRKDVLGIPEIPKATLKQILRSNKIIINDNEPGVVRALSLLNAGTSQ